MNRLLLLYIISASCVQLDAAHINREMKEREEKIFNCEQKDFRGYSQLMNIVDHVIPRDSANAQFFLKQQLATMKELIDIHHCDVNAKSNAGITALMIAVSHNNEDAVNFLLERGAEINAQDAYQSTPLIMAVFGNHPSMVRLLLDHGAQKDIRDIYDKSAIDYAHNDIDILYMLDPVQGEQKRYALEEFTLKLQQALNRFDPEARILHENNEIPILPAQSNLANPHNAGVQGAVSLSEYGRTQSAQNSEIPHNMLAAQRSVSAGGAVNMPQEYVPLSPQALSNTMLQAQLTSAEEGRIPSSSSELQALRDEQAQRAQLFIDRQVAQEEKNKAEQDKINAEIERQAMLEFEQSPLGQAIVTDNVTAMRRYLPVIHDFELYFALIFAREKGATQAQNAIQNEINHRGIGSDNSF